MDFGIDGRAALVLAAIKGLGRACALALAREGVRVMIGSRDPVQLEKTATELRGATGADVRFMPVDVTDAEQCAAILQARVHSVDSVGRFQPVKDPIKAGHMMGPLLSMFRDAETEDRDGIMFALRGMTGQADLNDFIRGMSNRLIGELRPLFPQLPTNLGCFIYPTNEFNAVCTYLDETFLILVHPGVFELVEHVIDTGLSKWPEDERAERIAGSILAFFRNGTLPRPYDEWPPGLDGDAGDPWRQASTWLATAAEEFALCHEFGHAVMCHLGRFQRTDLGGHDAIARHYEQEFEADLWASFALLNRYAKQNRDSMAYACAGSEIFLGIAEILEGLMAKESGQIISTHPATILRQYAITGMHRLLDLGEYIYLAQRFETELGNAARVLGIDRRLPGPDEHRAMSHIVNSFMRRIAHSPAEG